jgi:mannose-6-phosphate isomerase-like protein (cupin superfamily)
MPVVDHAALHETPWRPNYRKWEESAQDDGTTSNNLSISVAGPGAGAPLHKHESDELIVILEGEIDVRLGDDVVTVGRDHTLIIPPNVPHGFTVTGEMEARMLTFLPVSDLFDHTTFLEGGPPDRAN